MRYSEIPPLGGGGVGRYACLRPGPACRISDVPCTAHYLLPLSPPAFELGTGTLHEKTAMTGCLSTPASADRPFWADALFVKLDDFADRIACVERSANFLAIICSASIAAMLG